LHLAAEEGHHDIVSILLDNNAEYDVQDEVRLHEHELVELI
jgi:Ankyrin repeat.